VVHDTSSSFWWLSKTTTKEKTKQKDESRLSFVSCSFVFRGSGHDGSTQKVSMGRCVMEVKRMKEGRKRDGDELTKQSQNERQERNHDKSAQKTGKNSTKRRFGWWLLLWCWKKKKKQKQKKEGREGMR
jgi:hypothetical protein